MKLKTVEKRKTVLKPNMTLQEAREKAEEKKTTLFTSLLKKPSKKDIKTGSVKLFYEPYWLISGNYQGEFYRRKNHPLHVSKNVVDVKIGNKTFRNTFDSDKWSRIRKGVKAGLPIGNKKSKINLEVDEHVLIEQKAQVELDPYGNETNHNTYNDKSVAGAREEGLPEKVLEKNKKNVRQMKITQEDAFQKLLVKARGQENNQDKIVKMVSEDTEIDKFQEIYVPVFEARCTGPKGKVEILRIDGISKRIM